MIADYWVTGLSYAANEAVSWLRRVGAAFPYWLASPNCQNCCDFIRQRTEMLNEI